MDGIFLGRNLLLSQASFSRWNFGCRKAFLTNFFFFNDGISDIRKPFSRTFFFFHDGISAITKPFSRTFSFFTMEFWLSRSLSHELFSFYTMEFSRHETQNTQFGGRLFSFYIYQKEYLHKIRLVKNLAS
jgi:hypothetical protein